jgi:CubicO group peptidase (beta-lactamase class C family)
MRARVFTAAAAAVSLGFGLAWAQGPAPNSTIAAPATASAATAALGPRLAPGQPIPPAELEAMVDGMVRQAMTQDHIAGLTVAVVQDGQVILKKGYGFAGPNRPVDPDRTLFRIGSISKTFTWILVMKEVEAGRMRLDAPINDYLPKALQIPAQGFARPIRVRDLMTHRPGFEDNALRGLFVKDPAKVPSLEQQLKLARPERVREPGEAPSYSNYGAMLAGEAVAHVEGQPFETVVEREILGPLGMIHTSFREPYKARADLPAPMSPALAADASTGYRYVGGAFQPQPYEFITGSAPAGAGSSTAGDMARYMLMILGDGRLDGTSIYGPKTALGFRTPLQPAAPGLDGFDNGFMDLALPGGFRGHGHGGDTLWLHSLMLTVPELKLGVFVSANTETAPPFVDGQLIQRIVERNYAPPTPAPLAGSPALAKQALVYAGTYLSNRRSYTGLAGFLFRCIGQIHIGVTKDGRLVTPTPGGLQSWVPTATPGVFQQTDGPERIAFLVKDGRAVRYYPAGGAVAYDRIGPIRQAGTLILMTALAALAAIATLVGVAVRAGRAMPERDVQRRVNRLQLLAAALWIGAFAALGMFAIGAVGNQAAVLFGWPRPWLIAASTLGLAAALISGLALIATPLTWRGGDKSWTIGRRLRFSLTSLIFAAFGLQLALWGALAPWAT